MGKQKIQSQNPELGNQSGPAVSPGVKRDYQPKLKKAHLDGQVNRVFIKSTYNNTIITITDQSGNVLGWGSAGSRGFKGSKKSTPYAAQKTVEDTVSRLKDSGLNQVDVFVKGIGSGRESAVRALQGAGLTVLSIKDQTPIPHGGCRPKKIRRV